MARKTTRDPAVDQIVSAARRHVVAFAQSRGVSTVNWTEDQLAPFLRAERNLKATARRIVRSLRRQRDGGGR
jgi:hypothetical protein